MAADSLPIDSNAARESSGNFGARRRLPEQLERRHDSNEHAAHRDHTHRKAGFKRSKTGVEVGAQGGDVGLRGERAAGGEPAPAKAGGATHNAGNRLRLTVLKPRVPKRPGSGKRVEGRSAHGLPKSPMATALGPAIAPIRIRKA